VYKIVVKDAVRFFFQKHRPKPHRSEAPIGIAKRDEQAQIYSISIVSWDKKSLRKIDFTASLDYIKQQLSTSKH
jgi:hypothetical protein